MELFFILFSIVMFSIAHFLNLRQIDALNRQIVKFLSFVDKVNLESYPSIWSLILGVTNRWHSDFEVSQSLYDREEILEDLNLGNKSLYNPLNYSSNSKKLDIYKLSTKYKFPKIYFPNISNFRVILGPLSWLFALFGYSKRMNNILLFRNYKNGKVNRKLFIYFYNLYLFKKHRKYIKYWNLSYRIMNDRDYLLAVFIKTFPTWYKTMDLSKVLSILQQVENILKTEDINIEFKRVYIPKPDGRVRPLGVPSASWRVYLAMLNNLLSFIRVDSEETLEQHGYLPQKSVLTAWRSVLLNLFKFPYVYEFDLKGFFDNVELSQIDEILTKKYNISSYFSGILFSVNRSLVKLGDTDSISEPDRITFVDGSGALNQDWIANYRNLATNDGETIYSKKDPSKTPYTPTIYKTKGIPQGAATSPTLATMCLDSVMYSINTNLDLKLIMYADDGLIFAQNESDIYYILEELSKIVPVNYKKSSFVKFGGNFCKSLKFLGLKFDPFNNTFMSSTRKGATLVLGLKEKMLAFLYNREVLLASMISKNHNMYSRIPLKKVKFSVKEFIVQNSLGFMNLSGLQQLKACVFNPFISGYYLSSLFLNSFNFSIKEKHYFYTGKRKSWLNIRWTYVYRNMLHESIPLLSKIIDFEIEWLIYGILSHKFHYNIFNFGTESVKFFRGYLKLKKSLNTENNRTLSVIMKAEENCNCSILKKLLKELKMLIMFKMIAIPNVKNGDDLELLISAKDKKWSKYLVKFWRKAFMLSRFNASSFASYDLRLIIMNRAILSHSKWKYCYSTNIKILKSSETVILKESKKLKKERLSHYPMRIDQGFAIKSGKNI